MSVFASNGTWGKEEENRKKNAAGAIRADWTPSLALSVKSELVDLSKTEQASPLAPLKKSNQVSFIVMYAIYS